MANLFWKVTGTLGGTTVSCAVSCHSPPTSLTCSARRAKRSSFYQVGLAFVKKSAFYSFTVKLENDVMELTNKKSNNDDDDEV